MSNAARTTTAMQGVKNGDGAPEEANRAVVEFEGVGKRYGSLWALDHVDLTLRKGEVVALLGPNGAGKTTAIHLMLGLLRPSTGQVTVAGGDPTETRTRRHIGAMLQEAGIPRSLRVGEVIELFASYYPRPLPLATVLERASLAGLERRPYGRLSGGEKKRVQFGLAICGDPELVYLDEPTANMDVESRRTLHACIRALAGEGRSILFATHYMDEADNLASRIILLDRGRVVADGSPTAIKALVALEQASCRSKLAEEVVRTIPGVKEVERMGDRLTVRFEAGAPVVRELYRLDPELSDLTVKQADLEEAFIALVGKDARS